MAQIIINEGFLSKIRKEVSDFFKKSYKKIKQSAKSILQKLDQKYGNHKKPSNFEPGKLLAFRYDAKDKSVVFDKNPLVIMLGPVKKHPGNVIGINLHWLPVKDRVSIATFFLRLREKKGGKLTYQDVKPFISKFEGHPALRQYIINRISPKVIEIPDDEMFLTAAALPTEIWFYPQKDIDYVKALKKKGYSKEDLINMYNKAK